MRQEVKTSRILIGRLERGDDLLEALGAVCREEGVRLGWLEAFGTVQCARVSYYDQRMRAYNVFDMSGPMELLSLAGNVSLLEGKPVVHAHVTLGDASGAAFGGHLSPGTKVFACEYRLHVMEGAELTRAFDPDTGVHLWKR